MPRKRINRTGEKHGRLTIVRDDDVGKNPKVICQCSCGRTVTVMKYNVVRGNTTSCGCARSEGMRERMTGRNAKRKEAKKDSQSFSEFLKEHDPLWDDEESIW